MSPYNPFRARKVLKKTVERLLPDAKKRRKKLEDEKSSAEKK